MYLANIMVDWWQAYLCLHARCSPHPLRDVVCRCGCVKQELDMPILWHLGTTSMIIKFPLLHVCYPSLVVSVGLQ